MIIKNLLILNFVFIFQILQSQEKTIETVRLFFNQKTDKQFSNPNEPDKFVIVLDENQNATFESTETTEPSRIKNLSRINFTNRKNLLEKLQKESISFEIIKKSDQGNFLVYPVQIIHFE